MVTLTADSQHFSVLGRERDADVLRYQTDQVVGVLRPGSEFPHHGIVRLRHGPTGVEFVHPLYSLLNLYQVMGVDRERGSGRGEHLGQPRLDDHRVDVAGAEVTLHWPATEARRAEVTLVYTIREPNTIELRVTARLQAAYDAFEVHVASYCHPEVLPHVYLARDLFELKDEPGRFADEPELVPAVVSDVFRGGILVFPRDEASARLPVDGRWDGIVRESPVRRYKVPVCFQTDAQHRAAAVWMARPDECFAVATGYDSPDSSDRFKKHNPVYLCFFGDSVRPGDERTARARLVVTELDESMSQPLALYERFAAERRPG